MKFSLILHDSPIISRYSCQTCLRHWDGPTLVCLLLLHQAGGVRIWDPSVYYFNEVPAMVDWASAWFTAGGAVLVSVIAASFPAAHAADIDPVRALRYE